MKNNKSLQIKNDYFSLDNRLYSLINPRVGQHSELVYLNKEICELFGIEPSVFQSELGIDFLSGATNKFGTLYAQAYAGHQFGYFTNLGDGRALVLGELQTTKKTWLNLQLKGSGKTPYSRSGDGKATLSSVLREYLISEAMHHLGIPTTRSLAVLKTNELIQRKQKEKAGILCRTASSYLRIGTFQFARALQDKKVIKDLADYAISKHYSQIENSENKYQLLLREVITNQANLIAKWQSVGFIHGVMNTDNMTISGETIDYGPCAFMDTFKKDTVYSSIDVNGRYAYKEQPFIASWNLAKFAETIVELLSDDPNKAVTMANEELEQFEKLYHKAYYKVMAKKIGIIDPIDDEIMLINELLSIMEKYGADYTNTFRLLTIDKYEDLPFYNTREWKQWFQKWTRALGTRQLDIRSRYQLMEESNPVLIPRNLLVEEAVTQATQNNDFTLYNELLVKTKNPYDYKIQHEKKYLDTVVKKEKFVTYCGT